MIGIDEAVLRNCFEDGSVADPPQKFEAFLRNGGGFEGSVLVVDVFDQIFVLRCSLDGHKPILLLLFLERVPLGPIIAGLRLKNAGKLL